MEYLTLDVTGLRISDILKLQWRDFEMGPDQGYYIRICTEKTETVDS